MVAKETPLRTQRKRESNKTSRHSTVPPRNPNKKPTTINMKRSIGRMRAKDMDVIRHAK
ncbi:hypothetical protein [Halobacillus sp. K22]|uniref:hypothetical protein n=1 Tax=Halobacillus sp. K22 TaxID=3457431 RepID=UPI003FCD757A